MYTSTIMFELLPIFFPDPKKNNLPLPLYLPYMPSDVPPYWHLNYAAHALINALAVCFLIAVDGSMAVSILSAVYQIRSLKQCLLELDTSAEIQALHRELVFIVQTHVSARKYIRQLEKLNAVNLLVIFCFICLLLCMGMNVIATDIWSPIWFFLVAALFKLFLLCYFGNRLIIESDTLADCVYSIDWVSMPLSEQRLVLIMIANAQPALEMNGIFMPLSMASFLSIMKASYSYYTLLH
uniref:Uncharacterized protein n=1 Tax=Anopheles atroparvus TaxID=41427 RepID=A0A182JGJ2_ANOAO